MREQIEKLKLEAKELLNQATSKDEILTLKTQFLGKKGKRWKRKKKFGSHPKRNK